MIWRGLVLLHRYLGVAIGALMLVWFASGMVMLYVAYPSLSVNDRIALLEPLSWQTCCRDASVRTGADPFLERAEVESIAGVPALRFAASDRPPMVESLDVAGYAVPLDLAHARATAVAAARRLAVVPPEPASQETVVRDQWTVGGEYNADRPLIRFGFGDAAGTQLYVSSQSGRIILRTTAHQRFWNRLGAVPHWLYPTLLRSRPRLWSQVLIWSSLLGSFLTIIGLYLGIVQFRKRGNNLLSPYRGVWNWHHSLGLLFGILTLTWVFSGLVSMNPWGFLEGNPDAQSASERHAATLSQVHASLSAIAARPAVPGIVSLVMVPLSGDLFWTATQASGNRIRLDAQGQVRPMTATDLQTAARHAAGARGIRSMTLLLREDAYYYARAEPVVLPALRVIVDDADRTRIYLDPRSGSLLAQIDSDGRSQRWLFDALHRLDFVPLLRRSSTWRAVILMLLAGGLGLTATGTWLAVQRVIRDLARLRR